MSTADVDYAATRQADANRTIKTRTLADWCWEHGITPADIATWPQPTRNRAARTAGVNPPSRLSPTWALVQDLLAHMTTWAHQNPWDDRAWQHHTHTRPDWTLTHPPANQTAPDTPSNDDPVPTPHGSTGPGGTS